MGIFVWLVGSHDRASRKKQWILRDKKLSIFKKHFKIYFYPMIAYPWPSLNKTWKGISIFFGNWIIELDWIHVYGPETFNGFDSLSFIQSVFDSTFIVIHYVKINMPYPIVKCTAFCGSFGVLNERQISYSNKLQMYSYNIQRLPITT